MSFEQEWAGLKAAYAPEGTAHMRLAGADGLQGGGGGGIGRGPNPKQRLNVTGSVLRSRAGRAETVRGQFLKADDEVMRETGQITGTLKGFRTDAAIATFQERWRDQMSYVKQQFGSTASALRTAAGAFETEDHRRKKDIDNAAGTKDSHAPAGGGRS
ncbi:type VII secretion target [Streptomyces spirodelae]|uniref:WXG100 family type VII secretion target n=1 Tax=Streptomyces spirodelae TaxID=2812904 RepID=A0ABS3WQR2_9ACTN|nr:type VII secretion target [Streptomyces spirodelae]MBO8185465.1 hypothetical protein [Streptomyces spirodelae]